MIALEIGEELNGNKRWNPLQMFFFPCLTLQLKTLIKIVNSWFWKDTPEIAYSGPLKIISYVELKVFKQSDLQQIGSIFLVHLHFPCAGTFPGAGTLGCMWSSGDRGSRGQKNQLQASFKEGPAISGLKGWERHHHQCTAVQIFKQNTYTFDGKTYHRGWSCFHGATKQFW